MGRRRRGKIEVGVEGGRMRGSYGSGGWFGLRNVVEMSTPIQQLVIQPTWRVIYPYRR